MDVLINFIFGDFLPFSLAGYWPHVTAKIYDKFVRLLSARCKDRWEGCESTVSRARNKFKALVAVCKKSSFTRKSVSGIEHFIPNWSMVNGFPSSSCTSRAKKPHSKNSVSLFSYSHTFSSSTQNRGGKTTAAGHMRPPAESLFVARQKHVSIKNNSPVTLVF